ncbi:MULTISPECIES: M42 family metallopeptidase [Bacillus]|uniref:Endoglucanase n=1 Tax=Bacillus infantis NRRL B-14911 TaxID=1367477 RepID=U5LE48_9BACI|nr:MULTISPECIES: M42 family metallopeptidase [Bacillus]AGX04986.1 endoglucanase [Bacillus infantis NRRL B-14911]EAR66587.1 endoglucanase [Bacillus sp. NRRL B-14911]
MLEILKKLTSLSGPCGYEHSVSYFLKEYLEDKTDSVTIDPIGNVIARKKGDKPGPTIVLTAHIDEVGFIVKKIEQNGLLRFEKLGGNDDRIMLAQPVRVMGSKGEVSGVIGTISAHYAKFDDPGKVRKHTQMYIDIGASTPEEAAEMGVGIGTPVTWGTEFQVFGPEKKQRVRSKALDDRAGCAVLLESLEEVKDGSFAGELIFLFAVQEEVGLRGAKTASEHLQADAAIAVDTTAVSDTPEETMDGSLGLGRGTGIKVMDFSLIVHKTVKDLLVRLAEENKIPYQLEVFPGIGTDGGAVNYANKGIPTGVLSIPSRYAHSPVEVADIGDLIATKDLVTAFIRNLTEDQTFPF